MEYSTEFLKEASTSSHIKVQEKLNQGWEFDDAIPVGKNTVVIFRK